MLSSMELNYISKEDAYGAPSYIWGPGLLGDFLMDVKVQFDTKFCFADRRLVSFSQSVCVLVIKSADMEL